jgi:hypothetical protein
MDPAALITHPKMEISFLKSKFKKINNKKILAYFKAIA